MHRRHVLKAFGVLPLALYRGSATAAPQSKAQRLVAAAQSQIGQTLAYDPAYSVIAYPGGDVPLQRGVCTDVVIRAYRQALGLDLQRQVHEDMAANFSAYPHHWGLSRPDSNIDHRRVPNLQTFFARHGASLAMSKDARAFQPGNTVTLKLPGNLDHIALISSNRSSDGARPLLIHNIGRGTQEEDILFQFALTGHYRYAL